MSGACTQVPLQGAEHEIVFELRIGSSETGVDLQARADHQRILREIIAGRLNRAQVEFGFESAQKGNLLVKVGDRPDLDRAAVRRAVTRFGLVEFRLVASGKVAAAGPTPDAPPGFELLTMDATFPGQLARETLAIKREPEMTGAAIKRAQVRYDDRKNPYVQIELTAEGAGLFRSITRRIVETAAREGQAGRLAIVVDGNLISAPRVLEEITGGVVPIVGTFIEREALDLCNALNNPMDFAVTLVEERG